MHGWEVHGPRQATAYSQMSSTWVRIGSCKEEQYMGEYGDSFPALFLT